jgi:hypothetical protein
MVSLWIFMCASPHGVRRVLGGERQLSQIGHIRLACTGVIDASDPGLEGCRGKSGLWRARLEAMTTTSSTAADLWHRVSATAPAPGLGLVLATFTVALAGTALPELWRSGT